jgi:hypothetical protein
LSAIFSSTQEKSSFADLKVKETLVKGGRMFMLIFVKKLKKCITFVGLHIGLLTFLSSCGFWDKVTGKKRGGSSTASVITEPPGGAKRGLVLTSEVGLLSPEQFSKHLKKAFDLELTWTGEDGLVVDGLVKSYGVPLGGLEFGTQDYRDPTPKVQNHLAARAIAWSAALQIFWKDCCTQGATPKIFSKVSLWEDSFSKGNTGAWKAQLEDLYIRVLGRPPLEEEYQSIGPVFEKIANAQKQTGANGWAWIAVLYSLFSSPEYWNLVGGAK